VNILPGDEELELEEDVMSELGDSDEEIDPSSPAAALASTALSRAEDDYDSDNVSVLRMNASSSVLFLDRQSGQGSCHSSHGRGTFLRRDSYSPPGHP